jgi:uncharacterized protein YbjT (DUF2867 family)
MMARSRSRRKVTAVDTTSGSVPRVVAVTGPTGFVGRALVPRLVQAGYAVRRLSRHPETLRSLAAVDDRRFNLDDEHPDTTPLAGVDTAFYLVHAMGEGQGFADRDRAYAHRFADAARVAGIRHVIYLGGLYPRGTELSEHLASRREVGEILQRECGALHVRAGIIIGSGSASFEIMSDLVRRLPVMVTPRWVANHCQAIELSDAVDALVRAVDVPGDREVDLVGPEVLTYREMLQRMGRALGLRRRVIIDVPVLTPRLSAHWLRFVTSVSLSVARALVESLRHDAVADGDDLCAEVGVRPCGFNEAVRRALADRPRVVDTVTERRWEGHRYNLTQRFQLSAGTRCDAPLLARIDGESQRLTQRLALGVLRWHGNELRLAGWSLIRLGPWEQVGNVRRHSIDGGWLVADPGGVISFACLAGGDGPVVEASLSDYAPRFPRLVYSLVQGPVHRALLASSVRRAVKLTV